MIRSHGLDMKLVGAEVGFGGEKITFSFTSEERVDFRRLVADLSKALKVRVELRQVGAREEARMVGGLGPCGRGLCCAMFPGDDDPVSIRMAKEQNLPLNPTKISGLCGRLMCCLKYEQEQYVCFRKESPPKGTRVVTPTGEGAVTGYLVTKDSLAVRMEDGSHGEVRLCTCECQKDGSLLVTPRRRTGGAYPLDGHHLQSVPLGRRRGRASVAAEGRGGRRERRARAEQMAQDPRARAGRAAGAEAADAVGPGARARPAKQAARGRHSAAPGGGGAARRGPARER